MTEILNSVRNMGGGMADTPPQFCNLVSDITGVESDSTHGIEGIYYILYSFSSCDSRRNIQVGNFILGIFQLLIMLLRKRLGVCFRVMVKHRFRVSYGLC